MAFAIGVVCLPALFLWFSLIASARFFGADLSAARRAEAASDFFTARWSVSVVLVLVVAVGLLFRVRRVRLVSAWIVACLTAPICLLIWMVQIN